MEYLGVIGSVASMGIVWAKNLFLARDLEDRGTFYTCAVDNNTELLTLLIRHKTLLPHAADDIQDEDGNTPLLIALKNGFVLCAKLLCEEGGASITKVNKNGWNSLHCAAFGGAQELIEFVYITLEKQTPKTNSNNNNNNNSQQSSSPPSPSHPVPQLNESNDSGWTCLHVAAAKGFGDAVDFFLTHGADVNAKNMGGQTALLIASCNGFTSIVKSLLAHGADPTIKSEKLEIPLYLAAQNQCEEIVNILLNLPSALDTVNVASISGGTPLHAAASRGNSQLVALLIEKGGNVNAMKRDGCTPLHLAVTSGDITTVKLLLENGSDISIATRFGATPLHEAAFSGRAEIVKLLFTYGISPALQDNDGLTPLHSVCSASTLNRGNTKGGDHAEVVRLLLANHADVNGRDNGNSTPLHIAACAGEKGFLLVPLLLDAAVDLTAENTNGWTALHLAMSREGFPATATALENHARKFHPEFLATFDKDKVRTPKPSKNTSKFDTMVDGVTQATVDRAKSVFGDETALSLDVIAKRIMSGEAKKIVVLVGAGISVSAGIPDFRNPDSGIYSENTAKKYGLPSPAAAFDLGYLRVDPKPFYSLAKQIFYPVVTGKIKPTPSHYFLRLLETHNILKRIYTQNIDALEYVSGVGEDKVIEAHGSFKTCSCIKCGKPANIDLLWKCVEADQVPTCQHCGSTIRPGVVFFGEPLPSCFFEYSMEDLRECDLLIVMGTSLKVYPFAALVNDVSPVTPRLLFNKEEVGPFKGCNVNISKDTNAANENNNNSNTTNRNGVKRDIAWIGECDDGVKQLCELLGWQDELEALLR